MRWNTKGVIYNVSGEFGWMNSHAQVPVVLPMTDRYRVYFSTRREQTESRVARIDLSLDWKHVLDIAKEPVLDLGPPGTFDEHGNMPSSIVEHEGLISMYYSGWSRRTETPYANFTGLAISKDSGLTFEKVSLGPVIAQDTYDPYSATSPDVIFDNGVLHCYYCSGTGWLLRDGKYEHVYDIKYATSTDGIHWQKEKRSILPQLTEEEAITRPSVAKVEDDYFMWFCSRGTIDFREGINSYRIGVARSRDLVNWTRSEQWVDLPTTEHDNRMQAYPYVLNQGGKLTMLSVLILSILNGRSSIYK